MTTEPSPQAIGISVGVQKETIKEIAESIKSILTSGAEQKTMRCALNVLNTATTIKDVVISNCTIQVN